jgi:hypothetical protein
VTEACLEKAKANPEKTKAGQDEMEAAVDVFEERLDKMDTMDLEASREKAEAIAVHQEVPKEGTAVETIVALVDQYWGPASSRRAPQTAEEWTEGSGGSCKKLAAATDDSQCCSCMV